MSGPSPDATWSPRTQPVVCGDLESCPAVVLHYWAAWDLHDREMDERPAAVRDEYANRVCFRSCDVDRPENRPFIQGIANIPALGCFIRSRRFKSIIGLRSEEELRSVLDGWLAAAGAPADQTLPRSGVAGMLSCVQKTLRGGPGR